MTPEVRAESRAKQGELAITGHNDESHQASKCFATSAFSFNRNESRNGRLLHGMQGVSGSNPLGSISSYHILRLILIKKLCKLKPNANHLAHVYNN